MKPYWISILFSFISYTISAESHENQSSQLINGVIPLFYDLQFAIYLNEKNIPRKKQFTFDGEAEIQIDINRANITEIVLHSVDLTVQNIKIEFYKDFPTLDSIRFENSTELLKIYFDKPLLIGRYTLKILYKGKINEEPKGIYRYLNEDDGVTWIVSTQFTRSNARRAFPCFDVPKFKTFFQIKFKYPKHYIIYTTDAVAYQPRKIRNNRLRVRFPITPRMSTHNVAFHITNVQSYTKTNALCVDINFITDASYSNDLDFLNKTICEILQAIDIYTNYSHKLFDARKAELNVIRLGPGQVRQSTLGLLLLDSTFFEILEDNKRNYVVYLADELVRMWFGNLITAKYWNMTWIDNMLAEYVKNQVVKISLKDWNLDDEFTKSTRNGFLIEDQILEGLSLFSPSGFTGTSVPNNKNLNFINISRGPAILKMIESMFGSEKLKEAIQGYVEHNLYSTVTPNDLLTAFEEKWNNPKVNFGIFFKGWTEGYGYPLVQITLAEDGRSFQASQNLYSSHVTKILDKKWIIPVTYTTSNEKNFNKHSVDFYLTNKQAKIVKLNQPSEWIFANLHQSGYYRVNFDKKTWKKIGDALRQEGFGGFDVLTRRQILRNLFDFALADILDFQLVFEISEYASFESDDFNWRTYMYGMQRLGERLKRREMLLFGKYMQYLMKPKVENSLPAYLTTKDNNFELLFANLCYYGDQNCIKEANRLVNRYLSSPSPHIDHKLRFALGVAVYQNSEKYFDAIFEKLKSYSPKNLYILSCPSEENKMETLFDYLLQHTEIGNNVAQITNLLQVGCSQNATFEFVKTNFNEIFNSSNKNSIKHALQLLAGAVSDDGKLDDLVFVLNNAKQDFHIDEETCDNVRKIAARNLKVFQSSSWKSIFIFLSKNYRM